MTNSMFFIMILCRQFDKYIMQLTMPALEKYFMAYKYNKINILCTAPILTLNRLNSIFFNWLTRDILGYAPIVSRLIDAAVIGEFLKIASYFKIKIMANLD